MVAFVKVKVISSKFKNMRRHQGCEPLRTVILTIKVYQGHL